MQLANAPTMARNSLVPEPHRVVVADGYEPASDRFRVSGSPRGFLVVAGAIGVQQRFIISFAEYARACRAASATDDLWSPPNSRDAFLTGQRNAQIRTITYQPSRMKIGSLGHMGYFRSRAASLWPAAVDWLESVQRCARSKEFERHSDSAAWGPSFRGLTLERHSDSAAWRLSFYSLSRRPRRFGEGASYGAST